MTHPDPALPTLGPAFTLERELGGGGMSRVFLATEVALKRRVVVKVLPIEMAQGLSAERFAREITLAAQLQDPHIVPVLAAGTTDEGMPYYTMPFVAGESLRERMRRGAVPLEEAPVSLGLRGARLAVDPLYANLRDDPRFRALAASGRP